MSVTLSPLPLRLLNYLHLSMRFSGHNMFLTVELINCTNGTAAKTLKKKT